MTLLDDFVFRALLAGVGVAVAAGPIGCFVVWRRMAYFGDATSHAALLGVVLALAVDMPVTAGVGITALAMAAAVVATSGRTYALDTMLGVASHAALAVGLVAASLVLDTRLDLFGYLFGDILAVSASDIAVVWAGAAIVIGIVIWHWKGLLLTTLNGDLAVSIGISPARMRLVHTVSLAILVAAALKIVGALLITAMLIVPAAAARTAARNPDTMAVLSVACGALAVAGGLQISLRLDTPAGPSIVTAAVCILLILNGVAGVARHVLGR